MPYRVVRRRGAKPYKIIRKDTGRQVGESETMEMATSSMRARMAAEHGWKPTGGGRLRRSMKGSR